MRWLTLSTQWTWVWANKSNIAEMTSGCFLAGQLLQWWNYTVGWDRKWKRAVVSNALRLHRLSGYPVRLSVRGILQARILEWVAISFYKKSSQRKYQTQVSCIAGGFFTTWATRKVQIEETLQLNEGSTLKFKYFLVIFPVQTNIRSNK